MDQTDKSDTNETMSETIENSVVVDWLNCIDEKLFFHVCKVLDAELQSVPLFTLQYKFVENIYKYLKVIEKQSIEDILDWAAKPGASNTDIEFLPPTLWTSILSYLDTPDLTNIVLSCKFLSSVGSNPDLAWREMTIKSRAVLLFGLEHFLSISRFRHVETVDFSFVQLDPFELTSLCNFCLNNPVKNLNLSDKVFLELDNELVSESLSSIHTLKVRYSTFSNDQINMILKKTCQQKKLKVLDFLGAKIVGRDSSLNLTGKFLNLLQCDSIYFTHMLKDQSKDLEEERFHFTRHIDKNVLSELSINYDEIDSLPPNFKGVSGGQLETYHMVDLTWSQWTSILTYNIDNKHIREVQLAKHSRCESDEIKIPYQIFGESLAQVTILTFRGLKASSQQVVTLFDNLKTTLCLKQLELDDKININNVHEDTLSKVVTNLNKVTFNSAKLSGKQLTALLTHVLNNGSCLKEFTLHNVKIPKVHPNILGPGLAQFPKLDISGSEMADSQRGTLFFSILDTKKVKILDLEKSDLTRVNFVILATAVSSVQRANLSETCLNQDQVSEILRRCLASKTLKHLQLDDINVPEELKTGLKNKEAENLLHQVKLRFNIYTKSQPKSQVLTSVG